MAETQMNVQLIAHTQLSESFHDALFDAVCHPFGLHVATDGEAVALTAIRTCYSPLQPSQIVIEEGEKYFLTAAKDEGNGHESDRLFRHIVKSGHTSTLEHLTFTFAIEGVSRALLAQLTRHRVGFSYSVQSQRYVKLGSNDKSGGFDYVMPDKIRDNDDARLAFDYEMQNLQDTYDRLRKLGIPSEDARAVLPNAAATNLVCTVNLRALLDFYGKRRKGRGSQAEIAELADAFRREVTEVEPWVEQFFEGA